MFPRATTCDTDTGQAAHQADGHGRPGDHGCAQAFVLTAAQLAAARRRDPDAVTSIYHAYSPKLLRFFMANVGDRHLAEDLTGQVFESAIRALPSFRGPAEALGGWIFRIARNDLLDHRRAGKRRPTEPLEDRLDELVETEQASAPDPERLALTRLAAGRALEALRTLSLDQQEVLAYRLLADMSTAEVAEAVGKTVGAVKALQHRGLARLSRMLSSEASDTGAGDNPDPAPPDPSGPSGRVGGEEAP